MNNFKFDLKNGSIQSDLINELIESGEKVRLIRAQCEGEAPLHDEWPDGDEDFGTLEVRKYSRGIEMYVHFTRAVSYSGAELMCRLTQWGEEYFAGYHNIDAAHVEARLSNEGIPDLQIVISY